MPRSELARWARSGAWLRQLVRYDAVELEVQHADRLSRPLATLLLLRALGRGPVQLRERGGQRTAVSMGRIASSAGRAARDLLGVAPLLARVQSELRALERAAPPGSSAPWRDARDGPGLVLRSDPWYGLEAGGSLAHALGVVNELVDRAGPLRLFTPEPLALARAELDVQIFPPVERFWDFPELWLLWSHRFFAAHAVRATRGARTGFVYHRHGPLSYAGAWLARARAAPLVLEYNGSEVWVRSQWGDRPYRLEALARRMELASLRAARLVVVVSRALQVELAGRGIDTRRILVNPNGVDVERFHPGIDGSAVRRRLGLGARTVVGFIGSFGPWHGAPVLAEAFERLLARRPELRSSLALLWIGDGPQRAAVQARLAARVAERSAVFTGTVSPADAPAHLAACDVLVAPHVPNADGSEFFGSPTKLFEYMAMGRGIAASRLGQIAEVLRHGESAWLVAPGDPEDLARGLETLCTDAPLRARLGRAARLDAQTHHTWRRHTARIVERLAELSP